MTQDWRTAKPPRKATYEDKLRKEMHAAARGKAVAYLKELITEDPNRLVKSLQPHEVDALVEQILAGYIEAKTAIEFREDLQREEIRRDALKGLDNFA